jgi:hypothetical protein
VDIGGETGPAVKEGGRENRYQKEFFHGIQSAKIVSDRDGEVFALDMSLAIN